MSVLVEPSTGIEFPPTYRGMELVGLGVRVKYVVVKVYVIATYMNPESIAAIQKRKDVDLALLDPSYHRTIRIVMYREVDMETCISAILEALEPRMAAAGQDLDKLEEFKALNPPDDFAEGAIIEMSVQGDTLVYKNVVGDVGTLKSPHFANAVCDAYYGSEPISPTHKESVLEGLK